MATFTDLRKGFELGPWEVLPDRGLLCDGENEQHLEPMVMDVLVLMASAAGEVVTADQIVEAVWGGRPTAPEAIVQKIKVLRDKLGDNPKSPKFIETIPKIGYRLVCPVTLPEIVEPEPARAFFPAYLWPIVGGALAIVVIAIVVLGRRSGEIPELAAVNSVAVCRFENMSTEADEPFVHGFREQLVSTLYKLPDLRIVKAPCEAPVPDLPEELGVDSVVTGSVVRAGGRVRITAQLLASDGVILWSESIDGAAEEVEEVFVLHERVANHVRGAILGESEIEVTASSRPASLEAYDLYLLGDFAFSKRSKPEVNRSVEFFNEAINLDPNFGLAYLGLANAYLLLADYPDIDREQMYDKALRTVDQGAQLDPAIQDLIGTVYGFVDMKRRNWADATKAFETAINSATVYPTSHHWYSRMLANVGLLEKSLDQAKIAQEMDTADPILNGRLGVAYHWLNDSENANKYYVRAAHREVGSWIHNLAYTLFLIREQRIDEAKQKAKEALILYDQPTAWIDRVFDGLKNPTDPQNLETTIAGISAASASGDIWKPIELTLWALLGQGDRAMEAAWALHAMNEFYEVEIIYLDEFRVLREHTEFQALLDALGLPDYWDGIGCDWDGERVVCDQQAASIH